MKKYMLVTFVFSWLLWLPSVLSSRGAEVPEFLLALGMLAPFTPSLAGLYFIYREGKKEGLRILWHRIITFDFRKTWFIPVLLLVPVSAAVSYFTASGITGESALDISAGTVMTVVMMFFVGGPLAEEIGWRGFLLPKMLDNYSPLKAALVTGFIWGLWHLPLHFIEGSAQEWVPVWAYILLMMILSVIFTWIFVNTKRNVLVAMLFHWSTNLAVIVFPYWQIGGDSIDKLPNLWQPTSGMLIGFFVLLLVAAFLVLYYKKGLIRDRS
ncbi:MAG: CPBP family intramembrane metalloprotease [Dehalococcoidales bacterium]|nr:CPBP family intramembrane metalloprotease [Dehalococcoidales bacterium]